MRTILALLLCALALPAPAADREQLTANKTWTVASTGTPDFSTLQAGVDYICGNVDVRGHAPTLQLNSDLSTEVVSITGHCLVFIQGNSGNPRAVGIAGLQVRDHATVLFYNLSLPWLIVAQNSVVDFAGIVIRAGSPPSGFQITVDVSSKINAGAYSIDVGATGHVYVGAGSVFEQAGGVSVHMGWWPTIGTFYKAQWGGNIQIGAGVTYVDGSHVTGYQCDAENRGIIYRGGNTIPGNYGNLVGDGLMI